MVGVFKQAGQKGGNIRPFGKWTHDIAVRFLELCAEHGPHITRHCHALGIVPATELRHRRNDDEYGAAYEDMVEIWRAKVEAETIRRAMIGIEEPVFYQGNEVGKVRKFSDHLLLAILKRYDPAYREKTQVDLNVAGGVLVVGPSTASHEEWEAQHGPIKISHTDVDAHDEKENGNPTPPSILP